MGALVGRGVDGYGSLAFQTLSLVESVKVPRRFREF